MRWGNRKLRRMLMANQFRYRRGKVQEFVILLLTTVLWILAGMFVAKQDSGQVQAVDAGAGEANAEAPRVALTFDDGPNSSYTPEVLDGLRKRNVKATFFLQGQCLEGNEEIVRQMDEDGHLIGNHTYHHVQLTALSDEEAREEVQKTSNAIYEIIGTYPTYIRPPFGSWKDGLDLSVTMIPVLWTIDSRDWVTQNTDAIVKEVLPKVKDGSIILMHDGYQTSVESALLIVDQLKNEGYRFVTVDELIEE